MAAESTSRSLRLPQPGVAGALALALATFVLSWIILERHGTEAVPPAAASTPAATASGLAFGPLALTPRGLRVRVVELGQPVYWVGPERRVRYELKRTSGGSVFLRYLPLGDAAGDPAPYRTVGTYPFAGAYDATRRLAGEAATVWFVVRGGGIAVFRRSRPTNVYLAWPGFNYQVEIFDPHAAVARRLAVSSRLRRLTQ